MQFLHRLQRDLKQTDLAAYSILAPFDGIVTKVYKQRGEAVRQGDPILELTNTDHVRVEGWVDLDYAWRLSLGNRVAVRLNIPDIELPVEEIVFEGRITFIDVSVQPVTPDEWIENGWGSVDGAVLTRLGARVNPKARIVIKEIARKHHSESVTVLYNKPHAAGPVPQEDNRSGVAQLIRPDNHWTEDSSRRRFQSSHLRRLAPAGRLDADEAGMLVFTHEGSVARRVTGGDAKLEKEYHVRIDGELTASALERLRHGLSLDGAKLRPAQVSWLGAQLLRFVLHESRKQQIQRMCELVGTKAATRMGRKDEL